MSTINLRAKIDPSILTEIRKDWDSRCSQVDKRKASEKEIDRANKNIIKKLTEALKEKSYLKNAVMYIRDTYVTLVKGYCLEDKDSKVEFYFTMETNLPPLVTLLATDTSAKSIPSRVERAARILDRLVKTGFSNHKVKKTAGYPFKIYLDTQTKYSF